MKNVAHVAFSCCLAFSLSGHYKVSGEGSRHPHWLQDQLSKGESHTRGETEQTADEVIECQLWENLEHSFHPTTHFTDGDDWHSEGCAGWLESGPGNKAWSLPSPSPVCCSDSKDTYVKSLLISTTSKADIWKTHPCQESPLSWAKFWACTRPDTACDKS